MNENKIMKLPSWVKPLLWIALVGALVVAAVPTLLYPLTRDQGAASYQADLMMHGGAVFRDAWAQKGPGIQLLYVLAFSLFGRSEFAVRLFDVLWALVGAAVVYALAWEAFRDRPIASGSAWLYAFCYYLMVHFHSMATAEALMMPFLIASVYGMVRGVRSQSNRAFVLAGIAGSLVFWFKPTTGVVILAVLLWAGLRMWREGWGLRRIVRALAALVLGGVLGVLPVVLYLYGRGLTELLDIWRTYASESYLEAGGLASEGGLLAKLDIILGYLRDWQLFVWLSLAGALSACAWRKRNRPAEAVVVFLLSGVAATLVQGKLFEYHWLPVLAPLAILSAVSVMGLAREIGGQAGNRLGSIPNAFALVVMIGLALWLGSDHLARYRRTVAYLTGQVNAEQYYAQFDMGGDFSPMGARQAASYLQEHTAPTETALIWGAEPLVNFLAQRRSPTRYILSYVLIGDGPGLEAWRQEFLDDLRQAPPVYIVLVENDAHPLTPLGSIAQMEEIPHLKAMLETEYEFEAQVEDYRFYRRR